MLSNRLRKQTLFFFFFNRPKTFIKKKSKDTSETQKILDRFQSLRTKTSAFNLMAMTVSVQVECHINKECSVNIKKQETLWFVFLLRSKINQDKFLKLFFCFVSPLRPGGWEGGINIILEDLIELKGEKWKWGRGGGQSGRGTKNCWLDLEIKNDWLRYWN